MVFVVAPICPAVDACAVCFDLHVCLCSRLLETPSLFPRSVASTYCLGLDLATFFSELTPCWDFRRKNWRKKKVKLLQHRPHEAIRATGVGEVLEQQRREL